jgi:hypothetical protein
MNAEALNALADATEQAVLVARGLAEQARLRGLTAAAETWIPTTTRPIFLPKERP